MKKIISILLISICNCVFSQELINGLKEINFEDTSQLKFIKIDTNHVWFITFPSHKSIIQTSGTCLFTDTTQYYSSNSTSSFQFKLILNKGANGYFFGFNSKYDFDNKKDGGILETSWDQGKHWQNIIFDSTIIQNHLSFDGLYSISDTIKSFNQPGFTGIQSTFLPSTVKFWGFGKNFIIGDTILLRFTFGSGTSSTPHEGWLLDDFNFGLEYINIKEIKRKNQIISLFPNPSKGEFKIIKNYESNSILHVTIYNLAGEKIYSTIVLHNQNSKDINISEVSNGLYFVKINDGTTYYQDKIMVFK